MLRVPNETGFGDYGTWADAIGYGHQACAAAERPRIVLQMHGRLWFRNGMTATSHLTSNIKIFQQPLIAYYFHVIQTRLMVIHSHTSTTLDKTKINFQPTEIVIIPSLDELIVECRQESADQVVSILHSTMTNAVKLEVCEIALHIQLWGTEWFFVT